MSWPLLPDEQNRLSCLYEYSILDTIPEQSYNDIVALAAYVCQAPIALISFVEKHRQWFKARMGLEISETPRDLSFCAHAIAGTGDIFTVSDATLDDRFRDNAMVTGPPHIRFYAGVVLRSGDGYPLGTLCVVDRNARSLNGEQQHLLQALSRQVMALLEMAHQRKHLEQVLEENRVVHTELIGQNTILKNSLEGMAHLDAEGRFVTANSRYAASCGYEPQEMVGMHWTKTIHPDELDRLMELYNEMLKTGRAETETIGVRKDGSLFYKHVIMVPFFDPQGQLAGFYCFLRDVTTAKIRERRLVQGAYHDPLTDLPNRTFLYESLAEMIARLQRRPGYSFAVLYIDLDKFKPVNDRYGHAAGDGVLKEFARRIRGCVRPGDVAARLGGDEFVIALDNVATLEAAQEAAERIYQAIEAPFFWETNSFPIGLSIGMVLSSPDLSSPEEILRQADRAMYEAKIAGTKVFSK